ncbi:MAG: transporter [Legionellaceae bacterium]|nr:transporter [Legionellaceae bacterium]
MKSMQKPMRTLISTAVVAIISSTANAGGFSLYTEGNGYSVGNFGAGVAAEAADASTTWYNPAGLALIRDEQVILGGVGVFPKAQLQNGTTNFAFQIPPAPASSVTNSFSSLTSRENAFVPSGYFALPLGENATFGIGMLAPFGLSTDWGNTGPVRYAATFSELITVNLAPSIGGRLTDHFAVGAGIDLQYARVKFNSMLGNPVLAGAMDLPANTFDSLSYNKGQSFGVGFHAGVLGMFNDNHTRVGINYQSRMKHKFNGYSRLTGPLASADGLTPGGFARNDNLSSNAIEFPDVVTLSAYHDLNKRFALLGSAVYTGWSTLKTIELNNVAVGFPGGLPGIAQPFSANSVSTENYKNVWRFALGANARLNEKVLMRVGAGYDATPTRDAFRTVRLPDADRWALSVGGHYQHSDTLGFDLGYTYLWPKSDPSINKTSAAGVGSQFTVNATGKANAHLLGVQAVWKSDILTARKK